MSCGQKNDPLRLQWLILCVNLTGLWDAQAAGKILFLGGSLTVSQEEMSI